MNTQRRALLVSALGLLAILHILSALRLPIGAFNDDSLHIILARNVAHGSWRHLDIAGLFVNDVLPGFSWLLAAPVRLVEPHWGWLRLVGLFSSWAVIWLTWFLARGVLPGTLAAAAAFLVGINPVFVGHAGAVMPDIPYTVVMLALLACIGRVGSVRSCLLLGVGAAAASMLRPHGAILGLCLAAGVGLRLGGKRAAVFTGMAFLPLLLWSLRSFLLFHTPTGYLSDYMFIAPLTSFGQQLNLVTSLVSGLFGSGFLALPVHSIYSLSAAGLIALFVIGAGAVSVAGDKSRVWPWCLAAYFGLSLCLHSCWGGISRRYLIPLLPAAWIFFWAGIRSLTSRWTALKSGRATAAIIVLAGGLSLWADRNVVLEGFRGPADFQPRTITYLKEHSLSSAHLQSLNDSAVALLAERVTLQPPRQMSCRDEWLAGTLNSGVSFVHLEGFRGTGIYSNHAAFFAGSVGEWADSSPYLRKVFEDAGEGTTIVQISHPDPARFLKAWEVYRKAMLFSMTGRSRKSVRPMLEKAVALEPTLACAWAMLARDETENPARRTALLRRAMREDPTFGPAAKALGLNDIPL